MAQNVVCHVNDIFHMDELGLTSKIIGSDLRSMRPNRNKRSPRFGNCKPEDIRKLTCRLVRRGCMGWNRLEKMNEQMERA